MIANDKGTLIRFCKTIHNISQCPLVHVGLCICVQNKQENPIKQLKQNGSYKINHVHKYLEYIPQPQGHFFLPLPTYNGQIYIILTSKH